jgi:endonuclease YncB( thermonuclease family)
LLQLSPETTTVMKRLRIDSIEDSMQDRRMLRALFITAFLLLSFPTSAQGPGSYRVIDGDTIKAPFAVKYRLLGFGTPEIFHSQCDAELELGMAAKERLEEILASGEVRVIESGRIDKYRRTLAHVEVDGVDVGEILIGEGLARPYKGEKRKNWCE